MILIYKRYVNLKNSKQSTSEKTFQYVLLINKYMQCANCENHKHYECVDCQSNHSTYLCDCECHNQYTKPHNNK